MELELVIGSFSPEIIFKETFDIIKHVKSEKKYVSKFHHGLYVFD